MLFPRLDPKLGNPYLVRAGLRLLHLLVQAVLGFPHARPSFSKTAFCSSILTLERLKLRLKR